MTSAARDILVETDSPTYLDQSVQHFGAAVCGSGMSGGFTRVDGAYIVRCFGDVGFIKFAIENQGWGKVVREFDGLYNDDDNTAPQERAADD